MILGNGRNDMDKMRKVARMASGVGWILVRGSDWTSLDALTATGKVLRVARTGDEGEGLDVYLFDDPRRMCVQCSNSFSHETPDGAVAVFLKAMLDL